ADGQQRQATILPGARYIRDRRTVCGESRGYAGYHRHFATGQVDDAKLRRCELLPRAALSPRLKTLALSFAATLGRRRIPAVGAARRRKRIGARNQKEQQLSRRIDHGRSLEPVGLRHYHGPRGRGCGRIDVVARSLAFARADEIDRLAVDPE